MPDLPAISFVGVTKRFAGVTALCEVSFDVASGEVHAVVGENGAGKSTLMRCLGGVIDDFDGRIMLRGRSVRFRESAEGARAGVGVIHQELSLVEQLTVAENIFLGREKLSRLGLVDRRSMEQRAAELLGQLSCECSPGQLVGRLRVGDQQLVEIAKALSLDADILVMDEPTSALTETEAARLFGVIDRLRRRGATILYISHKMDEVFRLADRITVLRDGQFMRTLRRQDATPREVAHLMVGREIEGTTLEHRRNLGPTVLEVGGLSLPWPGHARQWRLRDINFALRRGEVLGLAGLMGAGRTELLECLFGASSCRLLGEIRLEGRPVRFRGPAEAMRAGLALVTEDRKRLGLFANLDVGQNISLCALDKAGRHGLTDRPCERLLAEQMVRKLGVATTGMASPIGSLSGGNQQKAVLGRCLLTDPKVLLLDDPMRGIDVGAKAELYRIIDELCRDGLGIIITSSELPELLTLCDRILVLCQGRITGELARREATEQRIMELAMERCGRG